MKQEIQWVTWGIVYFAVVFPVLGGDVKLEGLRLGKMVSGPEVSARKMKGKVVLVDFWWTECRACAVETGWMNRLWKTYGGESFYMVGIETYSSGTEIEEFVEKFKIEYPMTVGGNLKGVSVKTVPYKVLFGADGRVAALNPERQELEQLIPELMAEIPAVMAGKGPYEALAKLADQAGKGKNLGDVILQAEGMSRSSADGVSAKEAGRLLESIHEAVKLRRRHIDRLMEEDPEQGLEKLKELADQFHGSELGRTAREEYEAMSMDPHVRAKVEATRAWMEINEDLGKLRQDADFQQFFRMNRSKIKRIVSDCEELIEKWPDTKAAEYARTKIQEFSQ